MCGIIGVVAFDGPLNCSVDDVRSATDLLRLRGPDNFSVNKLSENAIFGHTRLSVLDLTDSSSQPYIIPGVCAITFNGEIYNFKNLRKQLEICGLSFSTSGDVEVVAKAFQHWGVECFSKFEGMWAIGIFDFRNSTVVISRDRFGEKPLNFYFKDGVVAFSSKASAITRALSLRPSPRTSAIRDFCISGIGAERRHTWFNDIYRVAPGTFEVFSRSGHSIHRYWSYPLRRDFSGDFRDATHAYREIFFAAMGRACISDVPFGVTLSSGLDSSSVISACVAQGSFPSASFTSTFDFSGVDSSGDRATKNSFDESSIANQLSSALGVPWFGVASDSGRFILILKECVKHLECGTNSPAVVPLWDLYRTASGRVKVLLEGQGADESLGGYVNTMMWPKFVSDFLSLDVLRAFRDVYKCSESESVYTAFLTSLRTSRKFPVFKSLRDRILNIDSVLRFDSVNDRSSVFDFFEIDCGKSDSVESILLRQHSGGLGALLHYGDSISMAHGVETRQPFLDRELVEFCFSLPVEYLVSDGFGKYVHRIALQGVVSDQILRSRRKLGFPTNFGKLLGAVGTSSPGAILLDSRTSDRGIFCPDTVSRYLSDHRRGVKSYTSVLFRLLCVELWMRNFVD